MLKQFQYTSIALLCSMAVACSSGGKGGQKPSPNQNPPRAEQPQPQPQPQAPRQEAQPDQAVPPKTDLAPNAPQQNGQADQPKAESEPQKDQQAGQEMPPKVTEPAPMPEAPQQNGQADQPKAESESQKDQKEEQAMPPAADPAPVPEAPQQNGQADQPKAEPEPQKDQQAGQEMPPVVENMPKQESGAFVVISQELKQVADSEVRATEETYRQGVEKLVLRDGKLDLTNPTKERTVKDAGQRNIVDDIGLSLLRADAPVTKGFGKVNEFGQFPNSYFIVRDTDLNEWKYQTFGTYFEHKPGANGFISFGEESRQIPVLGTASYTGIAVGSAFESRGESKRLVPLEGLEQIASEMKISADFGQKTLEFETTNTKGLKLVDGEASKNIVLDYSRLNLTGTASWDSDRSTFKGAAGTSTSGQKGELKGFFYGPNAAEIGGTFRIETEDLDYRGAFGGKREEAPAAQGK